jgi:hypothetical protein
MKTFDPYPNMIFSGRLNRLNTQTSKQEKAENFNTTKVKPYEIIRQSDPFSFLALQYNIRYFK